jgi:chitin disaccharide deacetylase
MGETSLSERLGRRPDERLLIINCDDAGSSHAANIATYRSMVYGVATSATLMVPCPWARGAARMLNGWPMGVHLTLTSEYLDYRWRALTSGASLHDAEGFLHGTSRAALDRLDPQDVHMECRAQIEAALSWGVDVTHLDAHMNIMQARDDLSEIYFELAAEFQLPVRMLPPQIADRGSYIARKRAAARNVLCPDLIIYPWPRPTRDVLFEEVPRLVAGVSEVFAHPVLNSEELRGYDASHADIRVHDAACLLDPTVRQLLDEHGIVLASFRDLRAAQRHELSVAEPLSD